jgi:hypothetical protein
VPNQNTGPAFGPQDYQGPFSAELRPPEPTPIAVPGAKIPKSAAAAAIIDKFLDGLQRGRQQQFAQEQNKIAQKRNALTSAYNQIQQDQSEGRVTAEGAAKAKQIYTNAMAGIALSDLDHGDDEAGKKPKKKKDGDQPQTPGQQVKGFAKQLLTNVVGKAPGGAVDPGSALIAMQNAVYSKDGAPLPQYNAKSQVSDIQNKIQQTQSQVPADATWNLAQPHFGPMLDKLRFLDPKEADRKEKELRELYAPTPTPPPPGSPEYNRTHLDEVQKQTQTFMGRPMTDDEKSEMALGQFGVHPTQKPITFGPKSSGKDLTFDVDDQGNPRDPSKTYVERKQGSQTLGYHPVIEANQPQAKTTEERAFGAYIENHKMPPGAKLTDSQQIKALQEARDATESSDIKASRELSQALARERLQQIQTGRANVKSIADGVQDGTITPDLTNVPREQKAEVQAELQRRHFNQREAIMDLQATKSFLRTMNGPRQVQLRQAVDFVVPSLEKVQDLSDDLSKYLKRDKNQLLTKANLALAMSGAPGYSQEAKQAATLMNQQITDVQSELAQIYSAGGSATNKKLEQAQQILNSSWDAKTLKSAIELARGNVQMRVNSIKGALPIGENGEIKPIEAPKDFSTNPFAASGKDGTTPPPGAGGTNPPKKQDPVSKDNDPYKN